MAFIQAIFALIGRSLGRILSALFGWAVVALFGHTSTREKIWLSALVGAAAAWPILLLGIIWPRVTTVVLSFVPPLMGADVGHPPRLDPARRFRAVRPGHRRGGEVARCGSHAPGRPARGADVTVAGTQAPAAASRLPDHGRDRRGVLDRVHHGARAQSDGPDPAASRRPGASGVFEARLDVSSSDIS
jgi:hypothetical protein